MLNNMFDFNAELEKLITEKDDTSNDVLDHDKECLISKEDLDDTSIKLECGHTFNYEPLYNEIVKQKTRPHPSEIVKLKVNQIKCPYCRNIQNKILPHAKLLDLKKITGVNAPAKWQMLNDRCSYSNNNKRSKYFNSTCNTACWGKYCNKHSKFKSVINLQNSVTSQDNVTNDSTTETLCKCILKTGARKGEKCNAKTFLDSKCKRHYNLANK